MVNVAKQATRDIKINSAENTVTVNVYLVILRFNDIPDDISYELKL